MAGTKHDKVVEILYELCKEYKPYKKIYADHISQDYKCISIMTEINKRKAAKTYAYNPDLWCRYKKDNGICVFEVWDDQTREACVEDILFSALTPDIKYLCIVCIQEFQYSLAKELTEVILNNLYNEEGVLLLDPKYNVLITLVSKVYLKDFSNLRKYLYKKLQFDY